jgi:hypothetical protein
MLGLLLHPEDGGISPKHWALYQLNFVTTQKFVLSIRTTANIMGLRFLETGKHIGTGIISAKVNI